jgi:hypothetical protein
MLRFVSKYRHLRGVAIHTASSLLVLVVVVEIVGVKPHDLIELFRLVLE